MFGLSTFLLDGAKLFVKANCHSEFKLGYGFVLCSAVFVTGYFRSYSHLLMLEFFCSSIAVGSVLFAFMVVELWNLVFCSCLETPLLALLLLECFWFFFLFYVRLALVSFL